MVKLAIPRLTIALAVMLVLAMLAQGTAQAHRQTVTLHNGNDAGWVNSGHHVVVACDGTNNGHIFGVEARLRSGATPILFDFGASGQCIDTRYSSEVEAVRWVCAEGRGQWRNA